MILLSDVEKLGLRGDVVEVARGYARNLLLPRSLAETATPAKVAELERREAQRARHEARSVEQAHEVAGLLARAELRFDVKAGPTGALFGSVTPTDIAEEIWRTAKVRVDRRKIELPESIKRIGRYDVAIGIFEDVTASVRTLVVPEGGELPPEEELAAMQAEAEAAEAKPEPEPEPTVEYLDEAEPLDESVTDAEPVETAPPGEPQAEPADALVERAAAGTLGPGPDPESA
ncbi:MAG: 50S ribosomal protein L9 [Gaiellaceae bacterium]